MGKPRTAEWWPRSDRGQAGRSNFFKLSLQLGARWLFCRLLTGGFTLSAAKLRTWENISLPTLAPTLKRSFSWSGKRRLAFFFSLELPSSHLQMDSRMCSAQKCTFWQRGAEPTTCKALSVSFERPRCLTWTSPQLTTSAFLESSSLCHVLCECHNKAGVGTNVDIRSSNSFLVQRICLHSDTHRQSHWKGSFDTADSFSQSPMLSAARASFGRRAEPNTRVKNRYRYSSVSLLILNLEEGDITLVGPCSLKTKVLPVAVDKWSGATLARHVVHGTVMSAASVGGQAARPRGRPSFQVWCPRHLREQPPFFARAKKAQKITEYCDTAPLITEFHCIVSPE